MLLLTSLSRLAFINEDADRFEPTHEIPMVLHIKPCLKERKETLIYSSLIYVTVKCIPHTFIKISVN